MQLRGKAGESVTNLVDGIHHNGLRGLSEPRPTQINKPMGQLCLEVHSCFLRTAQIQEKLMYFSSGTLNLVKRKKIIACKQHFYLGHQV